MVAHADAARSESIQNAILRQERTIAFSKEVVPKSCDKIVGRVTQSHRKDI